MKPISYNEEMGDTKSSYVKDPTKSLRKIILRELTDREKIFANEAT